MIINRRPPIIRMFVALLAVTVSCAASAVPVPATLPDPDGEPADQTRPVRVYILLGQSNMLGFGRIDGDDTPGTLAHLTRVEGRYPHLVDEAGHWTVRRDVHYIQTTTGSRQMPLQPGCGVNGRSIGIELQFGHVMGFVHQEPVVLLKACIGNRSLGWDLLPPGSERYEFQGRTYAGYGDEDSSWSEDDPYDGGDERNWYAGKQYDIDVANARAVLDNLADHYPDYAGQGYEVAGFVWWQGHKDQNPAHAGRYEQNLVHLIDTLRDAFNAPEAKFVLATIAFGGEDLAGAGLTVAQAQLAVSGETGNYPRFADNVRTIDARPFWREPDVSPGRQGHHYNQNAETYLEVGNALGRAMAAMVSEDE